MEWGKCPWCDMAISGNAVAVRQKRLAVEVNAETKKEFSYYARRQTNRCGACQKKHYFVIVDIVANPVVTEQFENTVFWNDGEPTIDGDYADIRVLGGEPTMQAEIFRTEEGDLYSLTIGPYRKVDAEKVASSYIGVMSFLLSRKNQL